MTVFNRGLDHVACPESLWKAHLAAQIATIQATARRLAGPRARAIFQTYPAREVSA
jgi:hypothetical protein